MDNEIYISVLRTGLKSSYRLIGAGFADAQAKFGPCHAEIYTTICSGCNCNKKKNNSLSTCILSTVFKTLVINLIKDMNNFWCKTQIIKKGIRPNFLARLIYIYITTNFIMLNISVLFKVCEFPECIAAWNMKLCVHCFILFIKYRPRCVCHY